MSLDVRHLRQLVNAVEVMSSEMESSTEIPQQDSLLDPLAQMKSNAATLITEICSRYNLGNVVTVPEGWLQPSLGAPRTHWVTPPIEPVKIVVGTHPPSAKKTEAILTCPVCNNQIILAASKIR